MNVAWRWYDVYGRVRAGVELDREGQRHSGVAVLAVGEGEGGIARDQFKAGLSTT